MKNKKHCVVITAYDDEKQLDYILSILSKQFYCYVHIDNKTCTEFKNVTKKYKNVFFSNKYTIYWGGMEHLKAIIDLLEKSQKKDWDYVHIISGQDIPLSTCEELLERFLNDTAIYIDVHRDTDGRRYKYFWPYVKHSMNYKNKFIRLLNLFFVGLQYVTPFLSKKSIGEFTKIYSGFIWGSYSRSSIDYCMSYLRENPDFIKDLETCKIPEEFCFQTILMNSTYKNLITNNNLRFWKMKQGDWGPRYLKDSDMPEVLQSKKIFARKVHYHGTFMKKYLKENMKVQKE